MTRLIRRGLLLGATATLGGCISPLLGGPAPRIFELTPKSTFDPALPKVDASIVVDAATASSGLNTARIAIRPQPTSLDYYANVVWVDVIPVMVQTLMVETLENSERIEVFARSDLAARAGYGLVLHVREFQAEIQQQSATPVAHVRLQARLLRLPQRISIGSTFADQRVPAVSAAIEDVVAAHDDALGTCLKHVAVWTITEVAADEKTAVRQARRN